MGFVEEIPEPTYDGRRMTWDQSYMNHYEDVILHRMIINGLDINDIMLGDTILPKALRLVLMDMYGAELLSFSELLHGFHYIRKKARLTHFTVDVAAYLKENHPNYYSLFMSDKFQKKLPMHTLIRYNSTAVSRRDIANAFRPTINMMERHYRIGNISYDEASSFALELYSHPIFVPLIKDDEIDDEPFAFLHQEKEVDDDNEESSSLIFY